MLSKNLHTRLFMLNRPIGVGYAAREYLDERYFVLTIAATLMLHLSAMYVWHLSPQEQVIDIPVRTLNIKLGDGDDMPVGEIKAEQPATDNRNDVENAISKMVQPQENASRPDALVTNSQAASALDKAIGVPSNDVQDSAHKLANVAKQFIRANGLQASSKSSSGSNSAKESEMMSRYEQLISLWIEKFKLYPADARSQGMQGETVVRIRIDRQGNIRYYILERSTGFQMLDQAHDRRF